MRCSVCRAWRSAKALCDGCAGRLTSPRELGEKDVRSTTAATTPEGLIDAWCRAHPLSDPTHVGRTPHPGTLAIGHATVSQRHALLQLRGGAWVLSDFGSANGTSVNDRAVRAATPLQHGDLVRFGHVSFFFCKNIKNAPLAADDDEIGDFAQGTAGDMTGLRLEDAAPIFLMPSPIGDGGVVRAFGTSVSLGPPEFQLLQVLVDAQVRGGANWNDPMIVSNDELLDALTGDAGMPTEEQLAQWVSSARRDLGEAGLRDLLVAAPGGLRLRLKGPTGP